MVVPMTYAADGQRRRGRPPRISRDDIVDAACELGIENLTMAAVAERLGVTHQSLYGWVQDRDELIDLVSDRLIRRLEIKPPDDPADWRDSLRSYANGLRRLAEEMLAWAERQGIAAAHARSYASTGDASYGPLIDLLRNDALRPGWVKLADPWLAELSRLLPEMQAERPHLPPLLPLAEEWQKRRLFEALGLAFVGDGQPLLLVLDDVWNAAHVDEDWNIEQWGVDEKVAARRRARLVDFTAAAGIIRALNPGA